MGKYKLFAVNSFESLQCSEDEVLKTKPTIIELSNWGKNRCLSFVPASANGLDFVPDFSLHNMSGDVCDTAKETLLSFSAGREL